MQHAEADAAAQSDAERQRYMKAAKLRAIEKLLWGSFNTSSEQGPQAARQGQWLQPLISDSFAGDRLPACWFEGVTPPSWGMMYAAGNSWKMPA